MKLKKITAILFTAVIALSGTFAQQNQDFIKICKKLSQSKIVRGDFEQIQTSSKTGRTVNSSGTYTISADDGMIWFTEVPVKQIMAVTKTYMIQEINGRQRKTDGSKNPTFTHMANVISSLFTGNYEEISRNFEVKCESDGGKVPVYTITLTPSDKTIASYIKQIKVEAVDSKNSYIREITMITVSDDSTTYRLKNQVVTDNLNSDEAKYFEK